MAKETKKKCELCGDEARMYCDSDEASLCWSCDEKVHSANFLVAKHSRTLLCHACCSPTPWTAAGPKLCRTVSVCRACLDEITHVQLRREEGESRREMGSSVEDFIDSETDDDSGYSSDDYDDDVEEEEEGENQVVPWSATSSTSSPPQQSSSSGNEGAFSSRDGGGAAFSSALRKRLRDDDDDDLDDQVVTSSSLLD